MGPSDDGVLVRRAADGDMTAFEALVDRHYPDCLRYAVRLLGDRAEAEDVVQDTFVRVYRSLHSYESRDRFRAWLYTILVNRCRSAGARGRRRFQGLLRYRARAGGSASPPPSERTALSARVRDALLRLPADQREAFLLKHVEELSYEEMAEVTRVGVSALKMRVKRARGRLRELLGDLNE